MQHHKLFGMLKVDPTLNPVRRYFVANKHAPARWPDWNVSEHDENSWMQTPRASNGGDIRLLRRRENGPDNGAASTYSGANGTDGLHGRDGRTGGSLVLEIRTLGGGDGYTGRLLKHEYENSTFKVDTSGEDGTDGQIGGDGDLGEVGESKYFSATV